MPRRPRGLPASNPTSPEEAAAEQAPQPVLRRRTPVPNGRAVTGGLLVAVSALGVAGAHLAAAPDPRDTYVVAAQPIAAGSVLEASHLTTDRLDLAGTVGRRAFQDPAQLEGSVALDPVAPGELVQAGDVLVDDDSPAESPRPELSVALERDRAVDGRLVAGDVVDLLATYGTGDGGSTRLVARHATVRAASTDGDGGFAGSTLVTVTLALADEDDLLAATHAAREDALTLVRSTGTDGAPDEAYRPADADDPDVQGRST